MEKEKEKENIESRRPEEEPKEEIRYGMFERESLIYEV